MYTIKYKYLCHQLWVVDVALRSELNGTFPGQGRSISIRIDHKLDVKNVYCIKLEKPLVI